MPVKRMQTKMFLCYILKPPTVFSNLHVEKDESMIGLVILVIKKSKGSARSVY